MRKRTRLAKLAQYLEDRQIAVSFLGWEREKGELERLRWGGQFVQERSILSGGGYASGTARLMYPLWMALVLLRCLLLPKGAVVWCLGWETAYPARLAGVIRDIEVIFDDADRFSMIVRLPGPFHRWLVSLERWTSRRARVHIVPGWTRYEWRHGNMKLLRNSPLREDYEEAAGVPFSGSSMGQVTVYFNGWIAWDTGARILVRALDELRQRRVQVQVIVAGRVASKEGRTLIARDEVDFRGELPQREALKLYRMCDLALTLYDPAVPINHHAESNKWGDCVFLGTPFIVNSEVTTAAPFVSAGAALQFPYQDHRALADLIEEVGRNPGLRERLRTALAGFVSQYAAFEDQLDEILAPLLRNAASGETSAR